MIQVGLTNFVDFVMRTGTAKLTVAKKPYRENASEYDPQTDYYRRFRGVVQDFHKHDLSLSFFDQCVKESSDNKKKNYKLLAKGYKSFAKKLPENCTWIGPSKELWEYGGIRIRINPEICLETEDEIVAYKLYMKALPIHKKHADLILHLFQLCFETESIDETFAVLDVRRGKRHLASGFDPELTAVVKAEAMAFSSMYESVAGEPIFAKIRKQSVTGE